MLMTKELSVSVAFFGTGHYLSPGGGGGRILGGISRSWEPKTGDHWKLWKDTEGGTTQICLENEGMWGGGDRESG